MGFLNFFKKKEDSLDIPPPPPPMIRTYHPLTPKQDIPPPDFNIPPIQQGGELKPAEEKESFPELPPLPDTPIPKPKEAEFEPFKQEQKVINPVIEQKPQEVKEEHKETEVIDEKHFLNEPLFVKTNQYQNMINGISAIKNKVNECDFIVKGLNDIKNKKDKEFIKWRSNLEGMQRKISLVERSLFEVAK